MAPKKEGVCLDLPKQPEARQQVVESPVVLMLRCGQKVFLAPGDEVTLGVRSYGLLYQGVKRRVLQ